MKKDFAIGSIQTLTGEDCLSPQACEVTFIGGDRKELRVSKIGCVSSTQHLLSNSFICRHEMFVYTRALKGLLQQLHG